MTEGVIYVDGAQRGATKCPACGLVDQHQQTISAHQVGGWFRPRRWVACFRCSSCAAPFTADVPPTRGPS